MAGRCDPLLWTRTGTKALALAARRRLRCALILIALILTITLSTASPTAGLGQLLAVHSVALRSNQPFARHPLNRVHQGALVMAAMPYGATPPPAFIDPPQQLAFAPLRNLPQFLRRAVISEGTQQGIVPSAVDKWSIADFQHALSQRAVKEVFLLKGQDSTSLRVRLVDRFADVVPKGVPLTVQDVRHLARRHGIPLHEGIPSSDRWAYSDFVHAVDRGWVWRVSFEHNSPTLRCFTRAGIRVSVEAPNDPQLIPKLIHHGVLVTMGPEVGLFGALFGRLFFLGFLLISSVLAMWFIEWFFEDWSLLNGGVRQMEMSEADKETGVTFDDVAGVDDAKAELKEVVDFLKTPQKYSALGAAIPKGVLLVGPPGTGKTLLAKAVAGEAAVPFFYSSASGFVELYAGLGASRVRKLFAKAKKKAPCIIFLDELDSIGRARNANQGDVHEEREQTLNQLLTEMDGFVENSGVIVVAATNRVDILDRALLRPGRFDRQVAVDPPDVLGREAILKVHARKRPLAEDVDLKLVARRTPGFTGADLRNLMNEAAIWASRRQRKDISAKEVADALERLLVGPEKTNAATNEARQKLVAYHEAGHALLGALLPDFDAIAKVTIIPRGQTGGLTFFTPTAERLDYGLCTRTYLEQKLLVAFGGRVAEELIFGEANATTGASGDFVEATRIANSMVASGGFSESVGPMAVNLGGELSSSGIPPASQAMAVRVDEEVQRMLRAANARARELLQANLPALHKIAARLMARETMDGAEVHKVLRGEELVDEEPPAPPQSKSDETNRNKGGKWPVWFPFPL
eukprot:GGOE01040474.1.p1 GENE.GGOE01040474.1~~GGOE01040474.1.p1  ORF type:complete len:805 (-),score=193.61 GGOE01040474.1:238-2652(-)